MHYVGTSVFVPFFLQEPSSAAVRAWFAGLDLRRTAVSAWTVTELASALGNKVRAGEVEAVPGLSILHTFRIMAHGSLTMLAVEAHHFEEAARLIERFDLGLRAGDALHVAIARDAGIAALVTLDHGLATAAARLGLTVEQPA
jgi:predicted nucleic acid-binding protein